MTDEGEGEHGIERSNYPSDEVCTLKDLQALYMYIFVSQDDSAEGSDEVSVIEDIAVMPPHTTYQCDPPEVFGTVGKPQQIFLHILTQL